MVGGRFVIVFLFSADFTIFGGCLHTYLLVLVSLASGTVVDLCTRLTLQTKTILSDLLLIELSMLESSFAR